MESEFRVGLFGAIGTVAFFAFVTFAVWIDYRKKKDERDAAHQERMKALELGYPPLDAEIQSGERPTASAAWAGRAHRLARCPWWLVALAVTVPSSPSAPSGSGREHRRAWLIVAWSDRLAGLLGWSPSYSSLNVIRRLPRPDRGLRRRDRPPWRSAAHLGLG